MRGSAEAVGRTPPSSSCTALIRDPYSFSLASRRSMKPPPSSDTPANRPFVLEYANTAATLFKLAAPEASAFRPTGPAAREMFAPKLRDPCCANVLTAEALLRMKTKSVSSKPICPPKPPPTVAMADGADHEPSDKRATTTPEPNRPDPRKPAFMTVTTAKPFALAKI